MFECLRAKKRRHSATVLSSRSLRFERFEERRLLATLTVNLTSDGALSDDGNLTLREALAYVNQTAVAGPYDSARIQGDLGVDDQIVFESALSGATVYLGPNSLVISKPVDIYGPTNGITIRPQTTPAIATYGLDYSYTTGAAQSLDVFYLHISGFTSGIRVGAIASGSTLSIIDCDISGSTAIGGVGGAGVEIVTTQTVAVNASSISNNRYGVYAHNTSSDNLISLQGNDISENTIAGIYFENANRPFDFGGNEILGVPSGPGIRICNSTSTAECTIDGENIIGNNLLSGIELDNATYPNLFIESNWIGTDPEGQDLGNGGAGIVADNSQVYGIRFNVIGFNEGHGISLTESQVATIAWNWIGTDTDVFETSSDLGNEGHGILLSGSADIDILWNTIAFNDGDGISIVDDPGAVGQASRNIIYDNDYWGNGGLPIDLNNDGESENDEDDGDPGPNAMLNYPILVQSQLTYAGGAWHLSAVIDVDKTGSYAVQLYVYDPDQRSYLFPSDAIVFDVNTLVDDAPDLALPITLNDAAGSLAGKRIVAVLIGNGDDNEDNTSEFSPPIVLDVTPPRVVDVVMKGSEWADTSLSYSYAELVPDGKQLAPIYTQGVNTIQMEFSEHVTRSDGSDLDGTELTLYASDFDNPNSVLGTQFSPAIGTFDYDSGSHVATWTFDEVLPADKYRLELSAPGVHDAGNNLLDGYWDNIGAMNGTPDDFSDDPTGLSLVSGNGLGGDDFVFFFSLLPGDRNQDGVVLNTGVKSDLLETGDVDGDGNSDGDDATIINNIVTANLHTMLPLRTRGGDYYGEDMCDNYVDDDDVVNELDYSVWKSHFNSDYLPADGNGDGWVDAADYCVWRDNVEDMSAWYTGPARVAMAVIVQFGVAPTVVNVTISGSSSLHDPYSFDSVVGSGEQLRTVPVGGADTISITFSEDVNVSGESLTLTGLYSADRPELVDFSYDLLTQTATWRFETIVLSDQYLISLSDTVTDVEGDRLDGEWVNPASLSTTNAAVSEFPSGDGEAGGDFNFVMTILSGDTNLDQSINSGDWMIVGTNYGRGVSQGYWVEGDFTDGDLNGDGIITYADFLLFSFGGYFSSGVPADDVWVLADLNGDLTVDQADVDILFENLEDNLQDPTWADGDLDGDGEMTVADLDLMFEQFGLELALVS
jgi:hypothetical protein